MSLKKFVNIKDSSKLEILNQFVVKSVKIVLKLRIKSRTYINSAVFIHFVTRETVTEKTQCIVQFDGLKEMTSSL